MGTKLKEMCCFFKRSLPTSNVYIEKTMTIKDQLVLKKKKEIGNDLAIFRILQGRRD